MSNKQPYDISNEITMLLIGVMLLMISCETPLNLLIRLCKNGLYKHSYCCFSLMINWLLFFPDEMRWIVALRFTLVLLVAVLSMFVSLYSFTKEVDCTGTIGVSVMVTFKS